MKLQIPDAVRGANSATSDAPREPLRSVESNETAPYTPRIRQMGLDHYGPTEVRIGPFPEPLNLAQKKLIEGAIAEAEFRGYACVKVSAIDPDTKAKHVAVTIVVPREVRT